MMSNLAVLPPDHVAASVRNVMSRAPPATTGCDNAGNPARADDPFQEPNAAVGCDLKPECLLVDRCGLTVDRYLMGPILDKATSAYSVLVHVELLKLMFCLRIRYGRPAGS